tara:strand:+ start:680 stop:868 length:189 start_codon:yes stop_codon:yes gene_type:complete
MEDLSDYQVAVQAAMQMAERFGEDVAIMSDLSVLLLKVAESPSIEVVRCPKALRKKKKRILG